MTKGKVCKKAVLDASKADAVIWSVPSTATITASKLLGEGDKAANQSCFDFLTNVLKAKLKEGTKFEDGVFDKTELDKITSEVTNVIPTLMKMEDNKDYAIDGGTFSFQFKNGDEKLGDVYDIKLKADDKKGVISAVLATIVGKFVIADTDVEKNKDIMFKIGETVPATATSGVAIEIAGETEAVKQFDALNKLTDLKITAQLGEVTHAGEQWAANDTLKIAYKAGDVIFAAETTLTLTA